MTPFRHSSDFGSEIYGLDSKVWILNEKYLLSSDNFWKNAVDINVLSVADFVFKRQSCLSDLQVGMIILCTNMTTLSF